MGARAYGGGHGNCPQIAAPTRNSGELSARVVERQELDSHDHQTGERKSAHTH
jgi:hypothetical protein